MLAFNSNLLNKISMLKRKYSYILGFIVSSTIAIMTLISGCATTSPKTEQASGAQLWAQKCQSCHNAPPPATWSTQQWDVVIYHMRVKAALTNKEAQKIVAFLKQ